VLQTSRFVPLYSINVETLLIDIVDWTVPRQNDYFYENQKLIEFSGYVFVVHIALCRLCLTEDTVENLEIFDSTVAG
jgi:hypothetical protein